MNKIPEIQIKYSQVPINERIKIQNSQEAFEVLIDSWNLDTIDLIEEFKVIFLNRANEVIGIYSLSKGGISATIVDVRIVVALALKTGSTSVIIAHNHPSGNLKPSKSDKKLSQKIKKALSYFDIELLDNLIITMTNHMSIIK